MAGVTLNDKRLAAEVRTLTLTQIKKYLSTDGSDKEEEAYKKQLLLRLAPTVLPRINEHTGEDGGAINLGVVILPAKNENTMETPTETGDSTS